MKKTILIICVAAACILFGLVAFIGLSGRNKNEEQQYRFYYINSDETRLKEEKYTPEKETTEVMLRNFSESLNNRETREDGISLFPDGVKISSYSIQDGVLNVEFNEAYDKMSRTRELLVRAGIVKIFLQVPGVDSVEIYVGKKPLTDTRGEEVGAMNKVVEYAKNLKPSARGELEITDLNRIYLEKGQLNVELLGQGFTWLDTGTHESLVEATNFVKTMEQHQHRKIACLEEIAYLNGWITKEDVLKVYEILKKNQYGQYLKDVLDGKYLDALH